MLSPFLDHPIGDPIIDAINAALGDLKNQPKRYDRETLEAVKKNISTITPQIHALKRDIERREALKAMLEFTDIPTILSDADRMLTGIFEIPRADFHKKRSCLGEPVTVDNLLTFVYTVLEGVTDEQAQGILKKYAHRHDFRYNSESDPQKEFQQFLDARINALLVSKLMEGLNKSITMGAIGEQSCQVITDHLLANNSSPNGTNALYIAMLEEYIRELKAAGSDQPIVYFSIGCGEGHSDVKICKQLKERIHGLQLLVVGFDPFATDLEHNLVITELNGKIVTHEIPSEDCFLDVIEQEIGRNDYPVIATDRYALHHMGYSIAEVRKKLKGIRLISVEEPITAIQRTNLYYRLIKIGWDILANHAFEVRLGGSWISEARSNSELFGVLYRRAEEIEEESNRGLVRVKHVGMNPLRQTSIIIYHPE